MHMNWPDVVATFIVVAGFCVLWEGWPWPTDRNMVEDVDDEPHNSSNL